MVGSNTKYINRLDVIVDVFGSIGIGVMLAVECQLALNTGGAAAMEEGVSNGDVEGEVDFAVRRFRPPACMAAIMRRKRAIETAKGFLSTPWTDSRARAISTQLSLLLDCSCQAAGRRWKAPRRKWPLPQAGSITRRRRGRSRRPRRGSGSRPNSLMARSRVFLRMNSSTNSGVCRRRRSS